MHTCIYVHVLDRGKAHGRDLIESISIRPGQGMYVYAMDILAISVLPDSEFLRTLLHLRTRACATVHAPTSFTS